MGERGGERGGRREGGREQAISTRLLTAVRASLKNLLPEEAPVTQTTFPLK